ncbi:hypothetical protein AMELA_G00236280 [Ameiurus melas]|uniref:Small monomeric GTPase n=1 Tax=Ameiurus melas TaxID=219545 RepID=A0A7J5ZU94_AMEME|nr:hypothetical protein AMELA_G00236280 [Ameiurus melas]
MVETLSIAVIGAAGVGKTSIIRRFVYDDFSETYIPTRARRVYRPSVVLNGHMYELKILDVPPIAAFPSSPAQNCSQISTRLSVGAARNPCRPSESSSDQEIRPAGNQDFVMNLC